MSEVREYWYSFQLRLGFKEISFHYEAPGDEWDPNKRTGGLSFDNFPLASIMSPQTEAERTEENRKERASRGPQFIVEQILQTERDEELPRKAQLERTILSREQMEDLRDALTSLLEYDLDVREMFGGEEK